ncbi:MULTISPECIES: hypothetical protein [Microvirga]|uniref:hypothetical protein n=1 Tax=Microvirga TaxID=186650 RepID=UPI001CFFB379|nr:hypothetical protein [Microvirga lenta]MCB5175912.1 hypothetical protein [Microvirga lenta]
MALALGLGLLFLIVLLGRKLWAWMTGARRPARDEPPSNPAPAAAGDGAYAPSLLASDLYAIRSNLNAVSRQIEDLERKLRLGSSNASVIGLKRK